MAFFDWHEKYNLGLDDIDQQHRMLMEMVSEFYDALDTGSLPAMIAELIERMAAYAEVHFETEEKLLREHGFPELVAHKQEHDHFREKVEEFRRRHRERKLGGSFEVTFFLKEWLSHHVLEVDRVYADWLKAAGVL